MRSALYASGLFMLLWPMALVAQTSSPATPAASTETICNDRLDNDGDGMIDCADADCFKTDACKPGGSLENTNNLCSDWVDNDADGATDCDDSDCFGGGLTVCHGSWKGPVGGPAAGGSSSGTFEDLPELERGMSVEDLIGKGKDKDGERSDEVCSDGLDNDADGATDCADYGCRFDPSVSVCRGNPGMRFSIVASVGQIYDIQAKTFDTRFTKLQLRSFGPLPFIQDSFYLVSMRAEKTPRLTFAMFQIPVGHGHFMNLNSGGGTLSSALIVSDAKQLLLDPAYFLNQAFEQGNGASLEFSGPILKNKRLNYRAYAAGGTGRFTGNIGGRYYKDDDTNYAFAAGGQLGLNLVGFYSRFDNPYLYTPVPTTVALLVGGKYDRRATEHFPAGNVQFIFRHGRMLVMAESYAKKELAFDSMAASANLTLGYLIWPKHLMAAADIGGFKATEMLNPPEGQEVTKALDEIQARAALHWYFWRNIGVLSARYMYHEIEPVDDQSDPSVEHEVRVEAQYRF